MSGKATLVVLGLAVEVAGLALVSAEDLAPWISRGRALVMSARRRLLENMRRALARPHAAQGHITVSDRAVAYDHATVVRGVDEGARLDAKFAFLIDEARRTQERLSELERRVDEEHVSRVNALNDLRQEVNDAIGASIETSRLRFVRLRRVGLVLLWSGAACLAIANLV